MGEVRSLPLQADEIARYAQWVGREETCSDLIAPAPLAGWAATLDQDVYLPAVGDALPPLAHWLYFLPRARQSALGTDGHAERGDFLPPVRLPRRMWAGGRISWERPLRVGDLATRASRVRSVEHKRGRSGDLVFVTVEHVISSGGHAALREEHDIVYRDAAGLAPARAAVVPAGHDPARGQTGGEAASRAHWSRVIRPSEVLLFRYSALTFNGHRIHYDRRYVTEEEGYPGLVVHGPLIATLLVDAARRHFGELDLRDFEFRALNPLFDTAPFVVAGRSCGTAKDEDLELWSTDSSGTIAMTARARRSVSNPVSASRTP